MAKFTKKEEEYKLKYPSRFGSHAVMVVKKNDDGTVVCEDDQGTYVTDKDRLDNGLSDTNRYTSREE